jgi:hypothetical protein
MSPIDAPAAQVPDYREITGCEIRCLALAGEMPDDVRGAYLIDGSALDAAALAAAAGIVLPRDGATRATELLNAGARRVLLGEAALLDSAVVAALATQFGGERIGVYVPASRMEVSWSFDTDSNADFKVMTPSVCAPAWEALRADGTRTGTRVLWWIGEMLKQGASEALIRIDIQDDADLNLCAECIEEFGDRLWIGPLAAAAPPLDEWIRYGHALQLALCPSLYAQAIATDPELRAAIGSGMRVERVA